MLALLIMERPVSMHPDDIRDEKTKAIRSMRVLKAEDVVIGQYTAAGDKPGYTDDEGVPEDSNTPTYSVCRLHCDNARWEGVPMLIKAGKAMNETKMEVRVQFKSQPGFFGEAPGGFRNEFVMQLKPKDAMYMKMAMKKPGLDMQTMMSELNLTYKERCGRLAQPVNLCSVMGAADLQSTKFPGLSRLQGGGIDGSCRANSVLRSRMGCTRAA